MLKTFQKKCTAAIRQAFLAGGNAIAPGLTGWHAGSALAILLAAGSAQAIGLGDLRLQSAIGQPLRASVAVLGESAASKLGTCFSARLTSADGAFIVAPRVVVANGAGGATLNLTTTVAIAEPALTLMLEIGCGDAVRKEFSLLLDPPFLLPSVPATSPVAVARAQPELVLPRPANASPTGGNSAPAPSERTPGRLRAAHAAPAAPAAVPTAPAAVPTAPAPKAAHKSPRNVLRLTTRDASDIDLMNVIGLRLALADRVGATADARAAAQIPDLAKTAADRAARARFTSILRGEQNPDGALQATEQKLQELQQKMQILETETVRLRQSSARATATADAAKAASTSAGPGNNLLLILGALLVLGAAVIAWLLLHMRSLRQRHTAWDWEENVPAEDTRAEPVEPLHAQPASVVPAHHASAAVPLVQRAAAAYAPMASTSEKNRFEPVEPVRTAPMMAMPAAMPETPRVAMMEPDLLLPDLEMLEPAVLPDAASGPAVDVKDLQFAELRLQATAVEEISDVMQEAEFWISLHDSQRAAEVLEPYATFDQPGSPLPWLYLFDLYVELGQREKYEVLQDRFERVFNGRAASWEEQQAAPIGELGGGIEEVPHVLQKICALWQSEQIVPYLESLLIDDRDGNRSGFDLTIYREIMFLIGMAYELQQSKKYIKPAIGTPGWTLAA